MNVGVPRDIVTRLSDFSGREWVFSRLDDWCQSDGLGLMVVGGPGSGKSWLVAELIRRRGDKGASKTAAALGGWHFCRSPNDLTLLPQYVISGLAAQLSSLPGYMDALGRTEPAVATVIDSNVTVHGDVAPGSQVIAAQITLLDASVEQQFDRVVRAPLHVLAQQGRLPDRLVLAVDGLDEALALRGGEDLIALLSRLLASKDSLPSGVQLLLTGRPDRRLLAGLSTEQLNLDDAASTIDIQAYARRRLSCRLPAAGAEQIAEQVAVASHTSFLYARYVLDDLLADPSNPIVLPDRLPEGLSGYYAASLDRELSVRAERWEDRYRPLLGALAVARSGLTAGQLSAITKLPRSVVDDALKRCSPYLTGCSSEPIRLFHQSFADYLLEEGQHTIYPNEAHRSIASYLKGALEKDQVDLIWHLAKAGDLQALDLALGRAQLARRERHFGSAVVVDDLLKAADGAATADDVIRTLRWSWAAAERRRHEAEAMNRQLLALTARLGHIDEALRGAFLLDPNELGYSEVITELAVQLVVLGRVDEALSLVARARLPFGTASVLAAVSAQIATTDPCRALQLTLDHEVTTTPQLCAALAAAGGQFLLAAEELAGTNPSALEAVVKIVGMYDVERAVEISSRIKHRYEPAAGWKQYRGPGASLAALIAEQSCSDPLAGRELLDRFLTLNLLKDEDAQFAIVSTALALSSLEGAEILELLQYVDEDESWAVTKGLVLAAAAASETPAHRLAALDRWLQRPQSSTCWSWIDASTLDLLDRLDLTRLGGTDEARTIASELFADLIERVIDYREVFEYPESAFGALAAAVAAVDPGGAIQTLERFLQGKNAWQAGEAKTRLVTGLARVDRGLAFNFALSAGLYHSHRSLVKLVEVLAATSLDDAIDVIDRVDTHYTGTRAELLGTVVAHVPVNDADTLERLQARLPQRGDSAAFLIPYAAAGMALAAVAVEREQPLAQALNHRCRGGMAYDQRVRDPLTVAEAVQLAADDTVGALDLLSAVHSLHPRISGTIEVLRRGRYDSATVNAVLIRLIGESGSSALGASAERVLIDLVLDLAGRDFDRAFDLALEHRLFHQLAPHLTSQAIDQFGVSAGVRRVVSIVLAAPAPHLARRTWVLHHRLVALFDAQPPTIDKQLLADLERRGEWDLCRSLEPWALAPSDPSGAYALLVARNLLDAAECHVVARAARRDLGTALTLSAASASDRRTIEKSVVVAASLDPHRCHAVIINFDWADEWARNSAYRAAVEPTAQHDPSLALDLVKRITDDTFRKSALMDLASAPIVAAAPMHPEWGVLPLIAIADTLPIEHRRNVLETITSQLLVGHPPCEVICRCLTMAARRDTQTYEDCLPHLLIAAYSASLASGKQLLDEFDAVAELIKA